MFNTLMRQQVNSRSLYFVNRRNQGAFLSIGDLKAATFPKEAGVLHRHRYSTMK